LVNDSLKGHEKGFQSPLPRTDGPGSCAHSLRTNLESVALNERNDRQLERQRELFGTRMSHVQDHSAPRVSHERLDIFQWRDDHAFGVTKGEKFRQWEVVSSKDCDGLQLGALWGGRFCLKNQLVQELRLVSESFSGLPP